MISIIKKSQIEATIVFNKVKHIFKEQLLNTIINVFPESSCYFIEICGVDVDTFIEDMQSDIYLLECDKSKRIIKNLPELFALCDCSEDVNLFGKAIGSFNEGYMKLHILKNGNVEMRDKQYILDFIKENRWCTIEVLSDGDVVNLICDNAKKIQSICDLLESNIIKKSIKF